MPLSRVCHELLFRGCYFSNRKFEQSLNSLKEVQLTVLKKQFEIFNQDKLTEKYLQDFPITEYKDWHDKIEELRLHGKKTLANDECHRFQPTSGSSSAIKWIPYSKTFLNELDQVIAPWMYDLYKKYPGIRNGRHYWSLSWIPTELRKTAAGNINNDLEIVPWWKRQFMSKTMAIPDETAQAETSFLSQMATACYLVSCRDLSLISVWSPTFFLEMIKFIEKHKAEISEIMLKGHWGQYHGGLNFLSAPKNETQGRILKGGSVPELWPDLSLISSWDSSTSTDFAKKLQSHFPHVDFQGKGLWATEGVVTFPFQDKFPLAFHSHFYEFLDLEDDKIYQSWELEMGQEVCPLITTGNGLIRYKMGDRIKVTDFLGQVPCFLFLGRDHSVDLVGEKLSPSFVGPLLDEIGKEYGVKPISLAGVNNDNSSFYTLIADGHLDSQSLDELSTSLDKLLCKGFHYNLARDLGQLEKVKVLVTNNAYEKYQNACVKKGMVEGNVKVEVIVRLNPSQYKELVP